MEHEKKTRKQLVAELESLRRHVIELEASARRHRSIEEESRVLGEHLRERVKELNCLYVISKLRENPELTIEEFLLGVLDLIPKAWRFPEHTRARCVLRDRVMGSARVEGASWKLTGPIRVRSEEVGYVQVAYLGEAVPEDGPFLEEERNLLTAIAEAVASFVEQREADEKARRQQEQLVHLDKMVALGTLVSGVAHEINNPNNFIMLNAPILLDACESVLPILDEYYEANGDYLMGGIPYSEMRETILELFSGIIEGARRIRHVVDGLKGFSRVDTTVMDEAVDMNAVVRSSVLLLGNLIKKSTDCFEVGYDAALRPVMGNFQRLEQVVVNLLQNACESLDDRSKAIRVATRFDAESEMIVVTVQDEGIGIPEEHLDKVMNPFFTTKRDLGGTGLGLSVSSGIVGEHDGDLSFQSVVGRGTTAILSLKAANSGPSHAKIST